MSSISGIQGLKPTIEIIKFTNKIAIANRSNNMWLGFNSKRVKK